MYIYQLNIICVWDGFVKKIKCEIWGFVINKRKCPNMYLNFRELMVVGVL